ncbi:MAG: RHS repeat-associated core domain-containing protein, partial [Janthinobacterium lividum]
GGITARATVHNINATTNRLDSITGGPPGFNVSYGYDVRGNVTQRNGQVFEYDLGNRLKRAVGKATYTYDGFRRRVSVVGTDGVTRVQVYAQDGKLLYVAPSGGTATKYVYLRNHVLAEVTGATVTYDHTDALGSPVAQTNAAGAVLSRTRYEPYGYMVAGTPRTIGFTGHVNDNDTTLVYMQQRYYDAFAGRFLGVDPVVTDADTGGSFNRYSYARNSPYAYIDPDGRDVIGYLVKLLDNGGKVVLRALDKAEAVSARKAGQNVQATSKSNAKQIEIAARNGKKDGILQHKGHELKNGSTGDPHFQTEGVTGHTFWGGETGLASVDLLETLLIPLLATPSALAPGTLYGPGTPYKDSEAYEESLRKRDAERNKEDEIIRSQTEQDRH